MAGVVLAIFLGFLGFCFLLGWAQGFRERAYLLFLAICLMTLAAATVLPTGPARSGALWGAGLFFVLAFIFAARDTLRNVRAVKEQRQALEQEMWAYLEELRKKHGKAESGSKE